MNELLAGLLMDEWANQSLPRTKERTLNTTYLSRLSMHQSYLIKSRAAFQGYTPSTICRARGWDVTPIPVAPVKLGYLSLGGTTPDTDITAMAQKFNCPPPQVTRIGTPQLTDPGGANVENCLDMWSAWIWSTLTGTPADITIAFCNNDAIGIQTGVKLLADAGVNVASISWGSPESTWRLSGATSMRQAIQYAQSKGMWVTVASGDNSEDDGTDTPTVDCPCCIPEVIAVGGLNMDPTTLALKVWGDGLPGDNGGGGGYSAYFSRPTYQNGFVARNNRGDPDISEVADPNTGYLMFADGQQMCVGGTSGAAPTVAGFLAVARGAAVLKRLSVPNDLHSFLYSNAYNSALPLCTDVAVGSNGLPSTVGWDAATGLGALQLMNLINSLGGTTVPVNPPPVTTLPVPPPVTALPPPIATLPPGLMEFILAAIDARFKTLEAANPFLSQFVLVPLNKVIDLAVVQAFQNFGLTKSDNRYTLKY